MDNRRLIIAMVLAFGLMFGWNFFAQFMGWIPERVPAEQQAAPVAETAPVQTAPQAQEQAPAFVATPGVDITVETPLYTAVINSNGGVLKSFTLNQYETTDPTTFRPSGNPMQMISPQAAQQAPLGLYVNNKPTWIGDTNAAEWAYDGGDSVRVSSGSQSITLHGSMDDIRISRTYTFDADTYLVSDRVNVTSDSPKFAPVGYSLTTGMMHSAEDYLKVTKVALVQNGSFTEEDSIKNLGTGISYGDGINWAGTMGSYFLAATIPSDQKMKLKATYQNDTFSLLLEQEQVPLGPGQSYESSATHYFGPKQVKSLEAAPVDLSGAMDYGWFGWISAPLLIMLKWFYSFAGNWGVAIILLTVVIKIIVWPLSYKSYKSMENMKKLQPLMVKIREKYKDDKQRQNQEVMQLYKTYKVNPMGGCLPIVIQLPIFFGLYRALLSSIELRQASFIEHLPFTDIVWLADLSIKDPLYITPIIMGVTMLLQQKMTPTTGDPTQAKIMMLMPVVFTFLFVSFPSGLVLYWLFNNIISIIQQQGQMRLGARKNK